MTGKTNTKYFDSIDRLIALTVVLIAVAACSKDDVTSPTPVASNVTVMSGSAQTATVGTSLAAPVVVRVTDQFGSPIAGASVSFVPASASGTASAATVTTDSTGSAQVAWTLGTIAGTDSMTVSVGSIPAITVVATATPDAPAAIAITTGNDQSASAGSALSAPLTVKVTDQYGNAVPNAMIQWSDDANGTLANSTTVTDANGVAQDSYTLGPSAGQEDVTAAVMNTNSPITAAFVEIGT